MIKEVPVEVRVPYEVIKDTEHGVSNTEYSVSNTAYGVSNTNSGVSNTLCSPYTYS